VFTVTFEETGSELIALLRKTEEIKLTGLFTTGCQKKSQLLVYLFGERY
jgi:hypothetical protein